MEKIPSPHEQILLTENREILAQKLEEYKKREEPYLAPELQFDTLYKIAVLEPLIQDGVVNFQDVVQKITEKYGGIDERCLANAWGVIEDYSRTGGAHTTGGTGLPKNDFDAPDGLIH